MIVATTCKLISVNMLIEFLRIFEISVLLKTRSFNPRINGYVCIYISIRNRIKQLSKYTKAHAKKLRTSVTRQINIVILSAH